MNTRLLSFANSAVQLEFDEGLASSLVNFLFRRLGTGGRMIPHITLRLDVDGESCLNLWEAGVTTRTTESQGDMAEWLVGRTGFHLADKSQGGVLFHAAAVYKDGRALILPGRTGAGKTTLTCWLLSHGYGYMSDEFAFLPSGELCLTAFPRPLNIKNTSLEYLGAPFRKMDREMVLEAVTSRLVAPESLTSQKILSQARLKLILFPTFQSGADYRLERMDPAGAGLALMQTILNLRNLARHGLPETAHLVREVPIYRLTYGTFDQLNEAGFLETITEILAEDE